MKKLYRKCPFFIPTFKVLNLQKNLFFSKKSIFIKPNTVIAVAIFVYILYMDGNVTKEIREDILKSLKTTFHRTLTLSFTVDTFFVLICSISMQKNSCGIVEDETIHYNSTEIQPLYLVIEPAPFVAFFFFGYSFLCVSLKKSLTHKMVYLGFCLKIRLYRWYTLCVGTFG